MFAGEVRPLGSASALPHLQPGAGPRDAIGSRDRVLFKFSCERAGTVVQNCKNIASFRDVFTASGCSTIVKTPMAQPAGAPRPEGLLPASPFLPGQGSGRLVGKGEGFMVPLRHPIHI